MNVHSLGVALLVAAGATRGFACASCGSGGDSPLVLYPNEAVKGYVGNAHQTDRMTVYPDGRAGEDQGPTARDTVTVAAGATFLTDGFATLTVPYVTNVRDGRSESGVGDALLEVRWGVLPASMLTPTVPQVQVLGAYKATSGRSIYDSEDDAWLDVFGSGFAEARAGVDVWWGQRALKYGVAAVALVPQERRVAGDERAPGNGVRGAATVAYDVLPTVKVTSGTTVEARGKRRVAGKPVADSEDVDHGAFAGVDWQWHERADARLTVARSAAYGQNKNTTRATSVTVAVMGSL